MNPKEIIELYKSRKRKYASKEEIQKRIEATKETENNKSLSSTTRVWAYVLRLRLEKLLK